MVFEICFCTKREFFSGVRNYASCLGPRATGRGRRGGGTRARLGSRTRPPARGQEEGGREGFTRLPLPQAPCTSTPALPRLRGGFLLPAPARQSRGAWLLAAALPFLRANNKVPIMQTRGLTQGLLTCPSGYETRAHHFNVGSFSAINAHLMSHCEVFNTCKSPSWGPVS